MQEDTCTKWCEEYEVGSGTNLGMGDQLQQLIKAATDSSVDAKKAIRKSNHEEFEVVRDRFDSFLALFLGRNICDPYCRTFR